MDIGYPTHAGLHDNSRHEEHATMQDFWDEHDWALSARQTGAIVAAIIALSALLSALT